MQSTSRCRRKRARRPAGPPRRPSPNRRSAPASCVRCAARCAFCQRAPGGRNAEANNDVLDDHVPYRLPEQEFRNPLGTIG
eukprot:2155418-Prymnesium_polylepis.1